jgi:hypothetical protein
VAGSVHVLKCWPEYFEAIRDGRKTFEWRKNDRAFSVEDSLELREWDQVERVYSGRRLLARVSYVLSVRGGYVVMALQDVREVHLAR